MPTGTVLLALGVVGDAEGYWDHWAFVTNLFSSLTSLMFGVPVALHVFSHLTTAQEAAAAVRDWKRRAASAATDMEAEVASLLGCQDRATALTNLAEATAACEDVLAAVRSSTVRLPDEALVEKFCATAATYLERFAERSALVQTRWEQVERLGTQGHDLDQSWVAADVAAANRSRIRHLSVLDDPKRRPNQLRRRYASLKRQVVPAGTAQESRFLQSMDRYNRDIRACAGESRGALKILIDLVNSVPLPPA
ncbi:hypothetical protein OHB54_44990 [Streptomyces sp. NBC_01007]|nr:hypothetical protein OHB54_44990 [Streptomyces sp. NBC_01007]